MQALTHPSLYPTPSDRPLRRKRDTGNDRVPFDGVLQQALSTRRETASVATRASSSPKENPATSPASTAPHPPSSDTPEEISYARDQDIAGGPPAPTNGAETAGQKDGADAGDPDMTSHLYSLAPPGTQPLPDAPSSPAPGDMPVPAGDGIVPETSAAPSTSPGAFFREAVSIGRPGSSTTDPEMNAGPGTFDTLPPEAQRPVPATEPRAPEEKGKAPVPDSPGVHTTPHPPAAADKVSAAFLMESVPDGRQSGTTDRNGGHGHRSDKHPDAVPNAIGATGEEGGQQAESTTFSPTLPEPAPNTRPGEIRDPLSATEEEALVAGMKGSLREALGQAVKPERTVLPGKAGSAAWLRTMLDHTGRSFSTPDGWHVLEMKLDPGEGTMTVRTRREADRVAVSIGFSDPGMRQLAGQHLNQLQDTLRAFYDNPVDLSFTGQGADTAGGQDGRPAPARNRRPASALDPGDTTVEAEARAPGANYVWVG